MSRKSVILSNGKEVAFGFDKFPYGYYIQVFPIPGSKEDEELDGAPEFEEDGLTKGQWFNALDKAIAEGTRIREEFETKASDALTQIALDLDINGKPFNGDLNVRPL